jgi:hypothetical protein
MVRKFLNPIFMKQLFALLLVLASFNLSFSQNPIVTENALAGTPKATWDISGAGDLSIQGFATDISVNKGQTVRFKIEVAPAASYTITIYRLGYYQGNGARLITSLGTFAGAPQPDAITNGTTGLIDCSTWSESANWPVPATAVSGLYIAKLTKVSGGGSSHIPFIVRDDARNSPILLKTSDATWQAYNAYGGNSLYVGATSFPNGHAAKVSYNRPFITRSGGGGGGAMEDWFMNAEYPLIRFLERNGYDVTYTTDVDMERDPTPITPANHKLIISSGHDEYWSLNERNKFENARDAGVHLAFFSGNEVYWKTRWENNYRTLVCYKEGTLGENVCGNKCDPTSTWTGLWRDGAAYDAGKPENELTGQISWSDVTSAIKVPAAYKNLRFWRGIPAINNLTGTGVATFPTGTLGYEWDYVQYTERRPLGYIVLSNTVVSGKTHQLSLYRHPSGALVFGSGTVQWAWGLDNIHDRGSAAASVPMQQATVNLFADMGIQPATLMSGLTPATASTDVTAPVVNITSPANNASLAANTPVTISGNASDAGGQLVGVYISVDGGTTWQSVTGTSSWTFSWTPSLAGPATIKVKGFDDSGNMGVPGAAGSSSNINVTITGNSPTCPCSIFPASVSPLVPLDNDGQPIEVGVKFRSSQAGFITGVKFWKGGASNNGVHVGHLWSSTGTKLAEANFGTETSSGWQTVTFSSPVAISANTTYVASYFSPSGYYSSTNPYFTTSVVNGYLTALANGLDGPNGLYVYTATGAFPNSNFQSSNNWVDVVFSPTVTPDVTPPTVNLTAPAAGNVSGTVTVSANAADNIGIAGVQFLLNGANLQAEDISAPYSISWNTASVANGTYTLTARARDGAGNLTTSAGIVVTVNNVPDNQAPTVSITAPAAGTVATTVNITATAADNVGVAGVQFLLNGVNLGTEDISAPFSYSWNTFTSANGTYTLTAVARDAAGNTTTSAGVIVTIANSNNLIVAMPLNEGSGTAAADISGSNHPGVLTNTPTWGAGKYGPGVTFNGTSNYISIADHADFTLDPAQSYTWSSWVKNTTFKEWSTVWSQTLDANNFFYFYAHTSTDVDGGPVTNGISVYWWANGGTNKVGAHSSNNVLTAGVWSHVAVTYDASQPQNNRFTIYVNGVDVTVRNDVSSTGTLPSINPANVRIGANQPFGEYLSGSVDEVRFYKRLLSSTEVNTDMNSPLAPDAIAPTVNITAPAAGNVSGTTNVTASAADNVGVVGVQFLLNGVNLGTEDLTSPYSISWNTTTSANGSYTLTARARDAAGNLTTSTGVVVTVNNDTQAPAVTLTEPGAGTVLGTVNVSANATDNVGVTGVQFLLDGNNLGSEDLVAPFTISWNTATIADGNHTLTARARDAVGNITTSAGVVVLVQNNPPDLQSPAINITAPAAGTVTGTVNVTANATDNVGVVGVQFLLNGVNLGTEDLVAPYAVSWNTATVANDNYTLTARARDAAGNITTSAAVVVTTNNDIQAPVVSLTNPAAGIVAGTINVSADATDNTGVAGVQFLLDGNNLGTEDLVAPYTISWNTTTITDGNHTLTARARDAAGNITTSAGVAVTVKNDTQSPTVAITAPAAGNVIGTINVTASASDNIGIVGVQFLLNGVNLGSEDLVAPYSISWSTTSSLNGNYALTARARDASGNITTSAAVNVTVNNPTTLIAALNLNEGSGTTTADISGYSHNGTLVNGPTWGAGKYGQGVNLDGTNDYINIPDHADFSLDPAQSYTWSGWLKKNNFNEWSTVWSQTLDANNFFYFYAHTSTDVDGGPVTNGISAYWWCNGGASKIGAHSSNNVLTAGQWSHVAITYDASQPQNNRFTIYVNGVDVTVRNDVSSTGTITAINPANIRIGSNQPFGEYMNGSVDEVRYYKRLLSAAEVQTDMNSPIASTIVPTVSPVNGATNVAINAAVTVVFNLAMDATTINGSTIELRNAANALVPATVVYNATTRTATLTPSAAMSNSSPYSAKVKGGSSGVKDAGGLTLATDYNWSFTTADPALLAPTDGPGGPILVVSSTTNAFSRYAVEILRAEGLNQFAAADVSTLTATLLNNYDVVVLGEMTVTAAQVTLLTNWVNAGGTLIAFKPSALLTPLMGLSAASGTLADKYLLVNTAAGPGVGIVNQTIQFHGIANLHTLNGATSIATLYSTASTATSNPAVTSRNVGANGGLAVAFTYDLAKSIIYTRQGNPAWAGQKRDGQINPIRSDDMFFPDWIDFNKVAIPQADEQQRLLANIILQGNLHRKPLPRFWYLPRDLKAAIVMTGDDHAVNGTTGRFNQYLTLGPNTAEDVADWKAVRGTSYIYPNTGIGDAQAAAFNAQGFEIALHPTTNCANYTLSSLQTTYTTQLGQLAGNFPSLPAPVTNRNHCLVWSDWASTAKVEAQKGMRLDVTYYYWPGAWVQNRPGMFTGSGIPMRFADTDGSLIDVYQAVTQMTDESGIDITSFCNQVLDKAIGPEGYYGVFTTNMHTDTAIHVGSNQIIASAQARQIPVISARQMLTWLDGRNNSFFSNMTWNGNQLSFNIMARSGAKNLKTMLPLYSETGQLNSITMNGNPVSFTTQTIKGIQYAFFPAAQGNNAYVADYGSSLRTMAQPVTTTENVSEKTTEQPVETAAEKLEVRVMPNPSNNYFNLVINSNELTPVTVRVLDVFGQAVEKHEKIAATGSLKIGRSLNGGTYFAEITQGSNRKVVKIVKVN